MIGTKHFGKVQARFDISRAKNGRRQETREIVAATLLDEILLKACKKAVLLSVLKACREDLLDKHGRMIHVYGAETATVRMGQVGREETIDLDQSLAAWRN